MERRTRHADSAHRSHLRHRSRFARGERDDESHGHGNREHVKHSFWRRHRTLWIVIAAIAIFLAGLRCALPVIVKHYVNRQLNKSKDYAGSIGGIGLRLWHGAYAVQDINIFKRNGKIREPFFSAPLIDFSLKWPDLMHGRIVTRVYMQQPKLNFVKGPTPAESQSGENTPWNEILRDLSPFTLDRLDINNGQIHYKDDYSSPPVDIYFIDLGASATNLSNSTNQSLPLPAGIRANAITIGGGSMAFHLQFNPMAPSPTYQLQASLTNVNLPALNNFFRAYGKFDVARGTFAMFTSVAATNQAYEGYTKVFFDNLDVFEWKKDRHKNILKIFWEAIVGTAADILKNQPHDQLATKVPLSGVYTNTSVGLDATIGTLLRNAFIQALLPKYDQKVTTAEVAQSVKEGAVTNANPNGTPKPAGQGGISNTNTPFKDQPLTPVEKRHPGTLLETPETGTNAPSRSPP